MPYWKIPQAISIRRELVKDLAFIHSKIPKLIVKLF